MDITKNNPDIVKHGTKGADVIVVAHDNAKFTRASGKVGVYLDVQAHGDRYKHQTDLHFFTQPTGKKDKNGKELWNHGIDYAEVQLEDIKAVAGDNKIETDKGAIYAVKADIMQSKKIMRDGSVKKRLMINTKTLEPSSFDISQYSDPTAFFQAVQVPSTSAYKAKLLAEGKAKQEQEVQTVQEVPAVEEKATKTTKTPQTVQEQNAPEVHEIDDFDVSL